MSDTLRSAIVERALEQRPAGRPVGAPPPSTPLDAFAIAAEQLGAVLRSLTGDDWTAHAHDEIGTVRDLVVHLVGVERLAHTWVTAPAIVAAVPSEHVSAARAVTADLDGTDPDELVAAWLAAVEQTQADCAAADPAAPILANDLPTDVDGFLVLRAFELWSHALDVCVATARPVPAVDAPRLALMSTRLMGAVPVALALRGVDVSAPAVRFVLTGDGGGVHDVELGTTAGAGEPLTIVADTVDVCLVAARRLAAERLDAVIEGDRDEASAILSALDAFARD
jgi:uncharacterized protein (TIGR03083 family)